MAADVLGYYQAIERASAEMLGAARTGDWNRIAGLEGVCMILIAQLRTSAPRNLTPEQRREKDRIMRRILSLDAQIRDLTDPWLGEIEQVLGIAPSEGSYEVPASPLVH